jgi:hypothetical protein
MAKEWLALGMEKPKKFHKLLLKQWKMAKRISLRFQFLMELFPILYKVKKLPELFYFAQHLLVLA